MINIYVTDLAPLKLICFLLVSILCLVSPKGVSFAGDVRDAFAHAQIPEMARGENPTE